MNIGEFSRRVLFATSLEDKLAAPESLLDMDPSGSICSRRSLRMPCRPPGLEMHDGPGAARRPNDANLENEKQRGRLLHFLANHELLATELMALVLLKFPDAPHAFRRGVLVTLQEEQAHTRMYLRRMEQCGVEFGSFPLSGHFWRVVEPMQEPLDFVSRLSLTFEQANLDYSLHYAKLFRQIGDEETARILQQIYNDEIGHVQHGLQWFRQWKDPRQSDWQAYQRRLTFPMSPQRARGPKGAFNREGRQKSGLTEEFIDSVELFRQSRGRTPTVRWFDPGAEAELASNLSDRDQILMQQLGKDLECLMVALAKQDDVMLVRRMPSMRLRRRWLDAGLELPEFVPLREWHILGSRKLHDLSPWAWTPKNHELAKPLLASTHQLPCTWLAEHEQLYRKSWAADCLRKWMAGSETLDCYSPLDCLAIRVENQGDVSDAIAEFASHGYEHVLVKQDLATSGRGQRRISCGRNLNDSDKVWLASMFDVGVGAVVEPELKRVLDLSLLWHLPANNASPKFLGWTRPLVTPGRRYAGTRLGRFMADCDGELTRFVLQDRCVRLHAVKDWIQPRLAGELDRCQFNGYFGVDAMVYRDRLGNHKIKPLVELNPRVTMGHVALAVERRLAPGIVAELRILNRRQWDGVSKSLDEIPLQLTSDGRIKRGVIRFVDVDASTKLVPVVVAGACGTQIPL